MTSRHEADVELEPLVSASSQVHDQYSEVHGAGTLDCEPLLTTTHDKLSHIVEPTLSGTFFSWFNTQLPSTITHSIDIAMEKSNAKGFKKVVLKLEVDHEPGLTNAQLMLTNHDLKPVEPERRQWGAWNFVGFWIADSFNIVGPTITLRRISH